MIVGADFSVSFERSGLNREVAKLGAVAIGEVVALETPRGARAWWRTYLPDDEVRAPIGAPSLERARRDLSEHVWQWLERAGVVLTRSTAAVPAQRSAVR